MATPLPPAGHRPGLTAEPLHARFDLAVIGAGAAGLSVAYGAARLGLLVALIERGAMGGECLNTGCVPSKALLQAARQGADWPAARARIAAAVAAIAPMDSQARYEGLGAVVLRGTARFTGPRRLEVDGRAIEARRIVIATGSRPVVPEFCRDIPHLTNETLWDLTELPAHLLILGGGAMGFEMADAFRSLGAQVTLVGRTLPAGDPALVEPVVAALRGRGVRFVEGRAVGARPGPVLVLASGAEISGSHLLLAAGRTADLSELNLAAAGIDFGPAGVRTDAGLRALGNRAVFAAGDCADPAGIGPRRLTHVAGSHAGIIIRRAVFRLPARLDRAPPVQAVFTAPELAQVGRMDGRVLRWPFAENDRAIAENETAGEIRLVIDARNRVIGAGIVGPGASEMIGLYALAVRLRLRLSTLAGLVLPYPTRGQAGTRAAGGFLAQKLFAAGTRRLVGWLRRLP
jgi:pyruvate/2-oxoglutarate dehydrogenase complex dihydrolipoamide dehydrogenase (E3) component